MFILNLDGGLTSPWGQPTLGPPLWGSPDILCSWGTDPAPSPGPLRHWLLLLWGPEKAHHKMPALQLALEPQVTKAVLAGLPLYPPCGARARGGVSRMDDEVICMI